MRSRQVHDNPNPLGFIFLAPARGGNMGLSCTGGPKYPPAGEHRSLRHHGQSLSPHPTYQLCFGAVTIVVKYYEKKNRWHRSETVAKTNNDMAEEGHRLFAPDAPKDRTGACQIHQKGGLIS